MWLHHCLPAIAVPEIISLSKACLYDCYCQDPSKSWDGNKEPGFPCWCCWIAVGKDPRSVGTAGIMMTLPCLMGERRHRRSKSPAQMKLPPVLNALQQSCFSLCSSPLILCLPCTLPHCLSQDVCYTQVLPRRLHSPDICQLFTFLPQHTGLWTSWKFWTTLRFGLKVVNSCLGSKTLLISKLIWQGPNNSAPREAGMLRGCLWSMLSLSSESLSCDPWAGMKILNISLTLVVWSSQRKRTLFLGKGGPDEEGRDVILV